MGRGGPRLVPRALGNPHPRSGICGRIWDAGECSGAQSRWRGGPGARQGVELDDGRDVEVVERWGVVRGVEHPLAVAVRPDRRRRVAIAGGASACVAAHAGADERRAGGARGWSGVLHGGRREPLAAGRHVQARGFEEEEAVRHDYVHVAVLSRVVLRGGVRC